MVAETLEQFELITDDPRVEKKAMGALTLIRAFRDARKQYGELFTRPLAAEILGVSAGQIGVWTSKGRLTSVEFGPVYLVPADEVLALLKERSEGNVSQGGRGHKLPSLADTLRLGIQTGEK